MYLIDTHLHLDSFYENKTLEKVLENARNAKVLKLLSMSVCYKTSLVSLKLAKEHKQVFASVGIYPTEILNENIKNIENLIKENFSVIKAIGEIGIDLHYDNNPSLKEQKKVFEEMLKLSVKYNLPVSIHARDAIDKVLNCIEKFNGKVKGVIHSFCYFNHLEKIKSLNLHIGIGGLITYASLKNDFKLLKDFPLDKIVLETDSPYLAPRPFKSNQNEPALIIYIAKELANIKSKTIDEIILQTTKNAELLFNI